MKLRRDGTKKREKPGATGTSNIVEQCIIAISATGWFCLLFVSEYLIKTTVCENEEQFPQMKTGMNLDFLAHTQYDE